MADEVTRPRPEGEENVQDIQIMLKSDANPVAIRNLTVSKILLCCECIIKNLYFTNYRSMFKKT